MAYKRYFYRNGKKFGPYYYESFRDENGKIRKKYVGTTDPDSVVKLEKKKTKKEGLFSRLKHAYSFRNLERDQKRKESPRIEIERKPAKSVTPTPIFSNSGRKLFIVVAFSLLLLGAGFFMLDMRSSGNAVLETNQLHVIDGRIVGSLMINLKQGELLPKDSVLFLSLGDYSQQVILSDYVNSNISSGDFYSENVNLSGSGEGYGIVGRKLSYPSLSFTFRLVEGGEDNATIIPGETDNETVPEINETITEIPSETSEENETIIPIETGEESSDETAPIEETPVEVPEEAQEETTESTSEETTESPEESSEETQSRPETPAVENAGGISGMVIGEDIEEIAGELSKESSFSYNVGEMRIEILSVDKGSVGDLNIVYENGVALITTEYSESEEGFGEGFVGDENYALEIRLDGLNISAVDGSLDISLSYGEEEIARISQEISAGEVVLELNESIAGENTGINSIGIIEIIENTNLTLNLDNYFVNATSYSSESVENISLSVDNRELFILPERDFVGEREGNVRAYYENATSEQNFTIIVLEDSINESIENVSITTKNYKIVLNRPVKWQKKVVSSENISIDIELPKEAENITVKTGAEIDDAEKSAQEEEQSISENKAGLITGNVIFENNNNGLIPRFFSFLGSLFKMTGKVTEELDITETSDNKIIGIDPETQGNEVLIEYTTPAPSSIEENIGDGKRVVVSAPTELNYTDILSFTEISEKFSVGEESRIKVYWITTRAEAEKYGYLGGVVPVVSEIVNDSVEDVVSNETSIITNESEIIQIISEANESEVIANETLSEIIPDASEEKEKKNSENVTKEKQKKNSLTGMVSLGIELENKTEEIVEERELVRVEVPFTALDLDENNLLDYVEWIVPHLSNQTYEIILISKAEHLDANRSFIANIYDEVKEKDGEWSEPIYSGEYVRVTFEQNLTSEKDITVYARVCEIGTSVVINGTAVPCEIYLKKLRIDEIRREG